MRFGEAVYFFVYEVPKVLLLLTLVVFGMGVVRTFVSPERTRALLSGRRSGVGNVLAALLGIVTPFCSCSAVPLFIGFLTAGVARSDALVPDLGAGIHGYVPEEFMASIMGAQAWWSVPLAVAIGVPMYSNAAGIIPVVQALLAKGAALGTALAFMMSVIALSLPELVILRKVLKVRLIAVFVGVVACGILLVGYVFNTLT